MTFTIRMY